MPRAISRLLPKRKAEFIEPMECALVPKLPEGPDWTYEVKLDGYRAIGVKTSRDTILYSRNGKNFSKRYPYVVEALSGLPPETVVDGEVVALDDSGRPDFHRLQHFGAEASRIHYCEYPDVKTTPGAPGPSSSRRRLPNCGPDATAAVSVLFKKDYPELLSNSIIEIEDGLS